MHTRAEKNSQKKWSTISSPSPVALLHPLCAFFISFLTACTVPNVPWRGTTTDEPTRVSTSVAELSKANNRDRINSASIEVHSDFTLAFVEFDDQGAVWNWFQRDAAIMEAEIASKKSGVIVVTYVHGWKHNAEACDRDVTCFRSMLSKIAELEYRSAKRSNTEARRVVGIYLGWRGLSIKIPVMKELTFWSRKAAAERIGRGDVLEFLVMLDTKATEWRMTGTSRNRVIILGHSFGADIVFSALEGTLKSRAINSVNTYSAYDDNHRLMSVEPSISEPISIGPDLVVLMNPAFEAIRFETLALIGQNELNVFPMKQLPVLVIISSKADKATRTAFPLGRRFGTLLQRTRDRQQRNSLLQTVGNFESFITHDMSVCPTHANIRQAANDTSVRRCACPLGSLAELDLDFEAIEEASRLDGKQCIANVDVKPRLERIPRLERTNPFPVISTTPEVSGGHSDIFTPYTVGFVTALAASAAQVSSTALKHEQRERDFWKNRRTFLEVYHSLLEVTNEVRADLDNTLSWMERSVLVKDWETAIEAIDEYNFSLYRELLKIYCQAALVTTKDSRAEQIVKATTALSNCGLMMDEMSRVMVRYMPPRDGEFEKGVVYTYRWWTYNIAEQLIRKALKRSELEIQIEHDADVDESTIEVYEPITE